MVIINELNDRKRGRSPSFESSDDGPTGPKGSKGNDGGRSNCGASGSSGAGASDGPRKVTIVNSIIPAKSPNDPNQYKVINMSNGLTAVLVSRKTPGSSGFYGCFLGSNSNSSHLGIPGTGIVGMGMDSKFQPECVFIPEGLQPLPLGSQYPSSMFCTDDNDNDKDNSNTNINGCQTKESEYTSVAIIVNCGGLNDPQDAQGLAHLTEHMVHYGSHRFQGEHQVKEVVLNFGTYNAFTTQMTTGYYNQVPNIILERNMELFSEMLTHPKFDEGMVHREVNAVDDEFHMRHLLIRKYLIETQVSITNPSHPLSRFICGSLETLGNGELSGSKQVRAKMVENYQRNYVASAMTLAISSAKPMDELENLALKYFSNVLQGERQIRHFTDKVDAEGEQIQLPEQELVVYLQGLTSRSELSLLWILSSSIWLNKENENTMPLIHHLLSSSQPGSLNAFLKNEELIWEMRVFHSLLPYATGLEINFSLTEKGENNTNRIQEATFSYIQLLQNTEEKHLSRLFDELRLSNLKSFHYGPVKSSLENTIDIAMQLQYVQDPSKILTDDSWNDAEFNYESIVDTLKLLKPSVNLVVFHTLKKQDSLKCKMEEMKRSSGCKNSINMMTAQYTKAKYFTVPRSPICPTNPQQFKFEFPRENVFLEVELQLLKKQEMKSCAGDMDFSSFLQAPCNFGDIGPQQLRHKSRSDSKGGIPKITGIHFGHAKSSRNPYMAQINIDFFNPTTLAASPRGLALCWLWVFVTEQKLDAYSTELKLGGYSYGLQYQPDVLYGKFCLSINGLPTHFPMIVDEMLNIMLSNESVQANYFNLAKQALKVRWESYQRQLGTVTHYVILKYLFSLMDMKMDFLGLVDSLTFGDLHSLISSFRKSTFALVKMRGNLPLKFFNDVAEILEKLDFSPSICFAIQPTFELADGLRRLYNRDVNSPGEQCIRIINESSLDFTCSVTNLYIIGPYNVLESELFEVAMVFINQFAFMQLRTKKQLGYVVQATKVPLDGLMAFMVHVTGTNHKHSPCKLDNEIDEFLCDYGDLIQNISDEIFDKMKTLKKFNQYLTQDDVAFWFKSVFGKEFHPEFYPNDLDIQFRCQFLGIRKLSVQVLPNPDHPNPVVEPRQTPCSCCRCSKIKEWTYGQNQGSTLKYAVGTKGDKYYVAY